MARFLPLPTFLEQWTHSWYRICSIITPQRSLGLAAVEDRLGSTHVYLIPLPWREGLGEGDAIPGDHLQNESYGN